MKILIITTIIIILIGSVGLVGLVGWHYETSRGQYTGYVTAVETIGIFFKTHRAYMKTETESSQVDNYCVVSEKLVSQLKEVSRQKKLVTVKFLDWLVRGIMICKYENAGIIYAIE